MNLQPYSGLVLPLFRLPALQPSSPDLSTANRRLIVRLELKSWPAFQRVTGFFHLPWVPCLRPKPQAVHLVPMDRPVSCLASNVASSGCLSLALRR
jgi:hypothetical protein